MANKIITKANGVLTVKISVLAAITALGTAFWYHETRLNQQQESLSLLGSEVKKQVELNLVKWSNLQLRLERIEGKIDKLLEK